MWYVQSKILCTITIQVPNSQPNMYRHFDISISTIKNDVQMNLLLTTKLLELF